jgi:tetratricopeptide (TPR) repeat protein
LYYLALDAANLKLWGESLAADEESVELYKTLARRDRDNWWSDVVKALEYYADHLQGAGQAEAALNTRREQIAGLRELFEQDNDRWRADLAIALYQHAVNAAEMNEWQEAITAEMESLNQYRTLAEQNPDRFTRNVSDKFAFNISGDTNADCYPGHQCAHKSGQTLWWLRRSTYCSVLDGTGGMAHACSFRNFD